MKKLTNFNFVMILKVTVVLGPAKSSAVSAYRYCFSTHLVKLLNYNLCYK